MYKKLFALLLLGIFIISLSAVSANDSDLNTAISDDIAHDSDNNVVSNSVESDVLNDDKTPSKITVISNTSGLKESESFEFEVKLTDENNVPIVGKVDFYDNNQLLYGKTSNSEGIVKFNTIKSSGFYYYQFKYAGDDQYSGYTSDIVELAFANGNTYSDLAMKIELSDGVVDVTKDYVGYGNNIERRNLSNYSQILKSYTINEGILISQDTIINGNNHTFDALNMAGSRCFFRINDGCTLTVNEMTFNNGYAYLNGYSIFHMATKSVLNLYNVTIENLQTISEPMIYNIDNYDFSTNIRDSRFINNSGGSFMFHRYISSLIVEKCLFINNSHIFQVYNWGHVVISYNVFINCSDIFYHFGELMGYGYVDGNYWGTNDLDYINNSIISLPKEGLFVGEHSFLTISGNNNFSEDYVCDYDIYFSGKYADLLPTYSTVITYVSNCSTINATEINLSFNPTTLRVSPETYGSATLTVEPDLYVYDINIIKSTKRDYNVTVNVPEAEYSIPFNVTVTVRDVDGNPVTTNVNMTINGTSHIVNVTGGVGALTLNLDPGTYDIKTKILSAMEGYRNTTVYSRVIISKSTPIISITSNTTVTLAREDIVIEINTKNPKGDNISALVFIEEDGVEIANITTNNGSAVFHYAPEAGNHQYIAKIHDEYWELSQSNAVDVRVISKTPTKLEMILDKNCIIEEGDYITIKVKLVDENDSPISKADINIIVNNNIICTNTTNNNGEIEFKFVNSTNQYIIKAVYNGNLTYYDNFTETVNVTIATGENFRDLAFLINAYGDSTLDIAKNYTYNENVDSEYMNGIPIIKNIKINGLNNTINALNKSRIFNIIADEVYIDNLNLINAYSYTAGAILFNGKSLYIYNSNFENNMIYMSLESINNTNPEFYGGGAIYSTGELYINNTKFYNNSLSAESDITSEYTNTIGGGAIYSKGYLYVNNSVFDSNTLSKIISSASNSYGLYASSIFAYSGSAVINNTIFNNSYSHEASVYSSSNNMGINISNSVFSNNWDHGEVLAIRSPYSNIINSTFLNNGGCDSVVSLFGECNITDSLFYNNTATIAGAIHMMQGANLTLNQSVFLNNNATYGGAIYIDLGAVLFAKYNIFVNNTADEANCIFLYLDEGWDKFNNQSEYEYNYWGTNNPFDDKVLSSTMKKCDYITLEIIGDNVTYTTIPTTYYVKFNGTNSDKLPVFETQMTITYTNGTVTNENITLNSFGKELVLTSDSVQNITVTIGQEYNNLTTYDITVKELIRKNYTSDITINNNIYGNSTSIDVNIMDADGAGVNGTLSYTFEGEIKNTTITNGKASFILIKRDAGEHNITINYVTHDLFYNNLTDSKSFEIMKINTTFQLDVNNICYGEDEVITLTPQRGVTGNYTLYIENVLNKTVEIELNEAKYTLKHLPLGEYALTATYNGDNNHNPTSLTKSFTVSKGNSTISINVGKITEGENVNIVFIVSQGATGNITYEIPGLYTPRNKTLSGVPVTWLISPLDHGIYTVNAYYEGDNNYYPSSNSTIIDFRFKSTLNITAKVMGNKLRFTANLTGENGNPINGNITVSVNGKSYNIHVTDGTGYYDIERLSEGNYSYTATFQGNDKFSNTTITSEFEVKTPKIIIDIPDVTKYYQGSERLYIYIKDTNGNPITNTIVYAIINNVKYNRTTNTNGSASFPLNMPPGEYPITAYINTTDIYEGAGTVKIISTITASDVVKIFKNATKYSAVFTDSKGNYLPEGTSVTFNINGVLYNRKVNNVGIASLNINLPDGKYILTANNPTTQENKSNIITVLPKIIENNNITKYYKNETQYTVKVLDDHGNPIGANQQVTFNINGVFYTRRTNDNGIAKLNINLPPGNYTITAEYADYKVSNLITVLSILTANDLNKQYSTPNPFVATLLDSRGKLYPGQTVTFNINGVFYQRVTRDDGQARLNINLPEGRYIITSTYNGLSISNTVIITS